MAAAGAGAGAGGVAAAGRGAAGDAGAAAARGFGAAPSGGSGVMMLTGGVEAAVGNSALVGLPVGIDGGSAATSPGGRLRRRVPGRRVARDQVFVDALVHVGHDLTMSASERNAAQAVGVQRSRAIST